MKPSTKKLLVLMIFGIAMAALESAVVVYLRALYYPDGFTVALRLIDPSILLIEIAREAATIVMICTVAYLAGGTFTSRLAYFLFTFAVWDIFYYVWLKVFIDWPASLFEWDILFLIPVVWLGPVLSPVIFSLTMILLAGVLLAPGREIRITRQSWWLLAIGALLILYTYLSGYGGLLLRHQVSDYFHVYQNERFLELASNYLPDHYSWTIFWVGELLICIAIFRLFRESVYSMSAQAPFERPAVLSMDKSDRLPKVCVDCLANRK